MKIEWNHGFIQTVMEQIGNMLATRVGQTGIVTSVDQVVRGQPRKYKGLIAYEIHLHYDIESDQSVMKIASSTNSERDIINTLERVWTEEVVPKISLTIEDMFELRPDDGEGGKVT